MRTFIRNNLIIILMLASFIGISILHIFIMTEMGTTHVCFGVVAGNDCPPRSEGSNSIATHISAMQNFLQTLPGQTGEILFAFLVGAFLLGGILSLLWKNGNVKFLRWRGRLRLLWQIIINFHNKIGSWLTLLEKRDPTHNILWAWV
jgi:hypothetical protein